MSDHIHFAILYLEIFLPAPTPSLILSLLWWSVWPTSTFTTTIATDDYDDEWWINRACITDSMKFPIELFSAFNSLFSFFSLHFSCLCFFVKKISLTFYWQLSCVSNQDIDALNIILYLSWSHMFLVDYKLIHSRNIFPTDLIIVAIQNDVICLQDWLLCVLKSAWLIKSVT